MKLTSTHLQLLTLAAGNNGHLNPAGLTPPDRKAADALTRHRMLNTGSHPAQPYHLTDRGRQTIADTEQHITAVTAELARLVDDVIPCGEGTCMGASAILAYVLGEHGIRTTAINGHYDEHPHWWLETSWPWLRMDPTRAQFLDEKPLVEPATADRDEDPYVPYRRTPARWDRDQAVTEFTWMFDYYMVGGQHARLIMAALEAFAADAWRRTPIGAW